MDASPRSRSSRVCVAAIALGATRFDCAFSLKHAWKKMLSPKKLYALTSLSVLLNPDKTPKAFGQEADESYLSLTEDTVEKVENHYYFPDFLRQMFENFTPGTKIEDVNGKDVDTDLLLYETLKFVVEQIMSTNGFKHAEIGIQDVDFVIVLPITCNNEVTRFVETIALKAGIQKDGLSIVSNGVAISLFAQHADEDEWDRSFERSFQWTTLQEKNMYLSVDFGEEQTTINKHLKWREGIDPLFKSTTFPVGSNSILSELLSFLIDALGTDVIEEFKRDFPEEYKSTIDEFVRHVINVRKVTMIPHSLKSITERKWKENMSTVLKNRIMDGSITESNCKMKMTEERIHRLCKSTLKKITKTIEDVTKQEGVDNVKRLFCFGELANSKRFQEFLREKMLKCSICIPKDASLVALKGGVYYGHVDNTHNAVVKSTCEILVCKKIDSSKHPVEGKMNEEVCYGKVVVTFLEKGDIIQRKGSITKRIKLPNPGDDNVHCFILSSRQKIGSIDLPFPSPPNKHSVYEETEFIMKYDSSGLSLEAHHVYKSQSFKVSLFDADYF
ncbi:uncharacterized protein LOC125674613 [Ostrea edulis]|uniref:uncharacterized protein LOC125674613 n=1 Tax=Ostrea edulis TaxID=37623 RepID=UPI002094A0FB|nr:uncharacterized protein LOC125674613 [Ostrea edulis]